MVELEKWKKELTTSVASFLTNSIAGVYGEHMQTLYKNGERNYDWLTGHLSDFGAAGIGTSMIMFALSSQNKYVKLIGALIPPSLLTIAETHCIPNLIDLPGKCDSKDIIAYWAGSLASYLAIRLSSSDKLENFTKNVVKKSKSKLEHLLKIKTI